MRRERWKGGICGVKDRIAALLDGMDDDELAQVYHLLEAKKQSYHRPLAFLQAVMDFQAVRRADGAFDYDMTITDDLRNRYGIVHGGVISTFIDTAMAETAFALDGELQRAVTLHLTVNFVKSAQAGRLHCRVTPTQNSHRIALFYAAVRDDSGEVIASAAGHFYKSAHRDAAP